jgi:hypothetical protein
MSPQRVIRQMKRRRLDPRLGRWFATDRLVPPKQPLPESDVVQRWARLLLERWGIVTKDILQAEACAPAWNKLVRAFKRLELLGKVNRGYFIESHQGQQYGLPEAIELLRDCRARRGGGKDLGYLPDEAVFSITSHDPANLYASCLDILDERGEPFKRSYRKGNMTIRAVIQAGQPLLYECTQIALLTRDELGRCIVALQHDARDEPVPVRIPIWNHQPIEASPAAGVLWEKGFRLDGRDALCWPPPRKAGKAIAVPMCKEFAPYYSEVVRVEYGPEWCIDKASETMRPCVERLLGVLTPALASPDWRVRWFDKYMDARYRGVAKIVLTIGKTVMNLCVGVKDGKVVSCWVGTFFRVTSKDGIDEDTLESIPAILREAEEATERYLAAKAKEKAR